MSRSLPAACSRPIARACAALLAATVLATGCADVARVLSPRDKGGDDSGAAHSPARVAFTARLMIASTSRATATLEITSSYLRRDESLVRISERVITLSDESTQEVPVALDVATCLADPEHALDAGTESACRAVITLALRIDGVVVDVQTVGPLTLRPGATTGAPAPVTLFEIDSLELAAGTGATSNASGEVSALLGSSASLVARVLDTRGVAVTGRVVQWSSASPEIATVNAATGALTLLAVGTTRIDARVGNVQSSLMLRVARPPAALTITGGPGSGAGRVRSTPAGIDCRVASGIATGACTFTFAGDANVVLASTPDAGSRLTSWGDVCDGSAERAGTRLECRVIISGPKTATAQFQALRRFTITATGDGTGRVVGSEGLDCVVSPGGANGVCAVDVADGSTVAVSAIVDESAGASTFTGWTGACATFTSASCAFVVNGSDRTAGVSFVAPKDVSVTIGGAGAGVVSDASGAIRCERDGERTTGRCTSAFRFGSTVTLTAAAGAGSTFAGWTGACAATTPTCTVAVDRARSVSAIFEPTSVPLTISINGTGGGSVRANGVTVCERAIGAPVPRCEPRFPPGTTVTLTGVAVAGSALSAFGGDCTGTTCTLVMSAPRNVTATFVNAIIPVTVTASGGGGGTVQIGSAPACVFDGSASSCTQDVVLGAPITITATPAAGSKFEGFTSPCGASATCTVTPTNALSFGVSFTLTSVRILVAAASGSTGTGTVMGTGISCLLQATTPIGTCAIEVPYGSAVSLVARPGANSAHGAWGGACASAATFTCTFVATGNSVVDAQFLPAIAATVNVTGNGDGAIALDLPGSPSPAPCAYRAGAATACTFAIPFGRVGQLYAQPAAGVTFSGFTGSCEQGSPGPFQQCGIRGVGFARTLSATFTRP